MEDVWRKEKVGSLERRRFEIIEDDKAVERKGRGEGEGEDQGQGESESGEASRRNAVCLVN
jgi:hypothetical protein